MHRYPTLELVDIVVRPEGQLTRVIYRVVIGNGENLMAYEQTREEAVGSSKD